MGSIPSFSISVFGTSRRAFQAFTSSLELAKKNQEKDGPIAMYVCLFSSQMSKINAGRKRETSKKTRPGLIKDRALEYLHK